LDGASSQGLSVAGGSLNPDAVMTDASVRVIRLRLASILVLSVTAALMGLFVMAMWSWQGWRGGGWSFLAMSPSLVILLLPLIRQRIVVDGQCIRMTPTYGRTRICELRDVASWGTRTFDFLMPTKYLDLYADRAQQRLLMSICLSPLDAEAAAFLIAVARKAAQPNTAASAPSALALP
jgi:hypothetical protein